MRATVELLADSSQIKTAEKELQTLNQTGKSVDEMNKRIGASSQQTAKKIGGLARSATRNRRAFLDLQKTTTNLKKEIDRLNSSAGKAKAPLVGLAKSGTKATKGLAGVGRNAGQAGIQVQQFVGQIQGGQSALLAFSQQSADLGFVLGAPLLGAVVGIGASLVGFLLPNLVATKTSADKLEESIATLTQTASLGKGGILEFSESIEELNKVSALAAAGRLQAAITQTDKVALNAANSIRDSFDDALDIGGFGASLDDAIKLARTFGDRTGANLITGVGKTVANTIAGDLGKALGKTGKEARATGEEVVELLANVERFGTVDSFTAVEEKLVSLRNETTNPKIIKTIDTLILKIANYVDAGRDAANTKIELNKVVAEGGTGKAVDELEDLTKSVYKLSTGLQASIIGYEAGTQAAEKYALIQRLVGTEQEDQIPSLLMLITKKHELSEAQTEATKLAREEKSALDKLTNSQKAAAAAAENKLKGAAGGTSGLTRLQALEQGYAKERELLLAAQAAGYDSEVAYKDRLLQLEMQHAEDKKDLSEQFELVDFEAFENRAAGAFASVATGAQTGKEAVHGLAVGLIQEGVGSLIKYGLTAATTWAADALGFGAAQAVKTTAAVAGTAAQTTASATAVGALTGTGIAAGATLAAAYAPAAAAASIATAGGAPAAATPIALGSIGAIIGALVGGLALGSTFARASGGQVRDGGSYLVGERGAELFTPNSSGGGRVTPFNQLMNEARGGNGNGQSVTDNSNVNINVSGAYQTGEDLLLANRDLIYRIVSDAKRRQGQRF